MARKNNLISLWIGSIACILAALVVVSLGVRIPAVRLIGIVLFIVGIALIVVAYFFQRRLPSVPPEELSSISSEEKEEIVSLLREEGFEKAVRTLREKHPGLGLSDAVDAVRLWGNSTEVKET